MSKISRVHGFHGSGANRIHRPCAGGGFALLELTIALVVLTIGLVGMMQASSRTQALSRENRERATAHNALRSMADRIQSHSDEIVRNTPSNWAPDLLALYGPGGTIGETFDARGINRVDDQTPVGTITVVTDENTTDEDLGLAAGMPRDLDGDGAIATSDVSAFATKVPVVLEIRWKGFRGVRSLKHVLWLTGI